jgi:hypothetical protein
MAGNPVSRLMTSCRAETGVLRTVRCPASRSTDVRFCRCESVGRPDTYALFGIFIGGSVDSAVLRYVVAANPRRGLRDRRGWAAGLITWVIARGLSKYAAALPLVRAEGISRTASAAGFRFACYWMAFWRRKPGCWCLSLRCCFAVLSRFRVRLCGIDLGCNGRVAAQLVQAAAAVGADAPDGDARFSADFVVWHRGVFGE